MSHNWNWYSLSLWRQGEQPSHGRFAGCCLGKAETTLGLKPSREPYRDGRLHFTLYVPYPTVETSSHVNVRQLLEAQLSVVMKHLSSLQGNRIVAQGYDTTTCLLDLFIVIIISNNNITGIIYLWCWFCWSRFVLNHMIQCCSISFSYLS